MEYYSTNGHQKAADLREAVLHSYAPDGGVYMPRRIPLIPAALFNNIGQMNVCDIAYVMCTSLFGTDIEPELINNIVRSTLNFPIPLVSLGDNRYVLELFHGPTESFKDVGARFLAQLFRYYISRKDYNSGPINVVLASTGDTGNAVTDAFRGIEGVNVFVLYPRIGKLNDRQLTPECNAPNIIPVEVNADVDRCREIIRQAFEDPAINRRFNLTSANSVNIGRLLPQTFYFFHAYSRLVDILGRRPESMTISTPCGNLGNLTAALFARCMGLPVRNILASGVGEGLQWGMMTDGELRLNQQKSKALTSNIGRVNRLIQIDPDLESTMSCLTFSQHEISETIDWMFHSQGYLMDRNTAMACRALESVATTPDSPGVFLATASPRKYAAKLVEILGDESPIKSSAHGHTPHHHAMLAPTLPALVKLIEKYN